MNNVCFPSVASIFCLTKLCFRDEPVPEAEEPVVESEPFKVIGHEEFVEKKTIRFVYQRNSYKPSNQACHDLSVFFDFWGWLKMWTIYISSLIFRVTSLWIKEAVEFSADLNEEDLFDLEEVKNLPPALMAAVKKNIKKWFPVQVSSLLLFRSCARICATILHCLWFFEQIWYLSFRHDDRRCRSNICSGGIFFVNGQCCFIICQFQKSVLPSLLKETMSPSIVRPRDVAISAPTGLDFTPFLILIWLQFRGTGSDAYFTNFTYCHPSSI